MKLIDVLNTILLPIKDTNRFKINKDYFTINNVKDNTYNVDCMFGSHFD